MPSLPWTRTGSIESDRDYVVISTRFVVTSLLNMPRVVYSTQQLFDALPSTAGLVGYSLDASAIWGTLSTLSAWRDREAMNAFVRSEVHRSAVRRTSRWLQDSAFSGWTTSGADLPPTWQQAKERLSDSTQPTTSTR